MFNNFLKNNSASGSTDMMLPLWLTIISGVILMLLAFLFAYLTVKYTKKHKAMMNNFNERYEEMSSKEKGNFTKEEFLNTNINMWNRNKHILFPLLTIICVILSALFFARQSLWIGL